LGTKKIAIVFGGNGFIGTYLIHKLREDASYSRIISADFKTRRPIADDVEHITCDVRSPIHIDGELTGAEIYNLAAVHTTPGHEDWEYFWTNVRGAVEVCDFATRIACQTLVFTSSISVYGSTDEPRHERGPLLPESSYGRSKLLAEEVHRAWRNGASGRKLVIVRPAVIFGPGEHGNFTRLAATLKRGLFAYPGRRDTIKACGYVGELVRSMLFARDLEQPELTYNFSYPQEYSSEDICEAFHAVAGYAKPRFTVPLNVMLAGGRFFEWLAALGLKTPINRARVLKLVRSTNIVPKRLVELGYKFETDLESGLARWKVESENGEFV
jgi:nucleoside-diphosphate-sugar epimerase